MARRGVLPGELGLRLRPLVLDLVDLRVFVIQVRFKALEVLL